MVRRGRNQKPWGRRRPVRTDWQDPRTWPAVFQLVGINVAVFLLWSMLPPQFMAVHFMTSLDHMLVMPPHVWTLVTYAFSHFSFQGHLFGNLLGLYFFGLGLEEAFGRKDVWGLYLGGALAAGVAHLCFNLFTGDPSPALGASGAVMAFGGAYATLWPNRTFLFNFFIPMPAWVLIGLYALFDLRGALQGGTQVAHFAHLGGLIYGFVWARMRQGGRTGRR
jgi:membrane associated rhomboid family serine protease